MRTLILGTDHPLYVTAAQKYLQGKSLQEIAKEEGCSHSSVRRVLIEQQVPRRPIGVHKRKPDARKNRRNPQ